MLGPSAVHVTLPDALVRCKNRREYWAVGREEWTGGLGVTYLMSGASYDGWKHGTRGVVSGETGLAHTGAIVHYESCYVVVTHDDYLQTKNYSASNT